METTETTIPTIAETIPETTAPVVEAPPETVPETMPQAPAETAAPTVPETQAPEPLPTEDYVDAEWEPAPTEVTEVMEIEGEAVGETLEYEAYLVQIQQNTAVAAEASGMVAGFCLTFAVMALCYFVYKFLRIFF